MDSISWGLVLGVALVAGVAGAFLYSHRALLLQFVAPGRRWLGRKLAAPSRRPTARPIALPPPSESKGAEDTVVLIPDGRPWPLGPAVQLLELAWRWQVVHGNNLPLRARQGEGAYVWRPPLPAQTSTDHQSAEAER